MGITVKIAWPDKTVLIPRNPSFTSEELAKCPPHSILRLIEGLMEDTKTLPQSGEPR